MRQRLGAKLLLATALASPFLSIRLFAGQVVLDNTFGHAGALSGPNFSIGAALGKQVGPNLFQSFSSFSLDKGDVATFTGPASVNNVLGRVGSPANIDGTLHCTIPHANFYLIDSGGVVFGPDAKLDVQGSFAVTTADVVHLGQSGRFPAHASTASVLSSAAPSAFGFLGSKPAGVSVSGATLAVPAGKVLSIVSGNVQISGGTIQSSGGGVNLVAVSSPGEVGLDAAAPDSKLSAAAATGEISLVNSTISADGPGGGEVMVRGRNLAMTGSAVSAKTLGAGNGAGIQIGLGGDFRSSGSSVATDTLAGGNAGNVSVRAQSVQLNTAAQISAGAEQNGVAGDVRIRAAALQLFGGSTISSSTAGSGRGGNVTVHVSGPVTISGESEQADSGVLARSLSPGNGGSAGNIRLDAASLQLLEGGEVNSSTIGLGNGGTVSVRVSGRAELSGEDSQGFDSGVFAETGSSDQGGVARSIHFAAAALQILDGGQIDSGTFGLGNSGDVTVKIRGEATISGADSQGNGSAILAASQSGGAGGSAGNIHFAAAGLQLLGGGEISSSTLGLGSSGDVTVKLSGHATIAGADSLEFDSGVLASSDSTAAGGSAGSVSFIAGSLQLLQGGAISSSTSGLGKGGDVRVELSGRAMISGEDDFGRASGIFAETASAGQGGAAGSIHLSAGRLQLLDGGVVSSSTIGLGDGGTVRVNVPGNATISGGDDRGNDSGVFASSNSTTSGGAAGSVHFVAANLGAMGGGRISSSTFGLGSGGDVTVDVSGTATISGADGKGIASGIIADTASPGPGGSAGKVHFAAASLQMLDGAEISSSTFGLGRGGDVTVKVAGSAVIVGEGGNGIDSGILADSVSPGQGGSAGSIHLSAGSLQLFEGGVVSSSTFGLGNGGTVKVNVLEGTTISGQDQSGTPSGVFATSDSAAAGAGRGGDIGFSSPQLVLLSNGQISAASLGPGLAGNVVVSGNDLTLAVGGTIRSSAEGGGNAGSVVVDAASRLRLLSGGLITALSVQGTGGNVRIRSGLSIVLDDSAITTKAAKDGGNIRIAAPASIVLRHGSEILADSAADTGGNISIDPVELALRDSGIHATGPVANGTVTLGADRQIGVVPGENVTATGAIVNAPTQLDIAGSLLLLQTQLASPSTLLPQCSLTFGLSQSSFIVTGRGGTPTAPGSWQPDLNLIPQQPPPEGNDPKVRRNGDDK